MTKEKNQDSTVWQDDDCPIYRIGKYGHTRPEWEELSHEKRMEFYMECIIESLCGPLEVYVGRRDERFYYETRSKTL